MHNLGTVIRFEIVRMLKKKSFWIAALAFPVIAAFIGFIIFFSNKATDDQSKNLAKEQYSLGVTDDSKIINEKILMKPAYFQGIRHQRQYLFAMLRRKIYYLYFLTGFWLFKFRFWEV